MAIYRKLGSAAPSREAWSDVDLIAVVRVSGDEVVYLNSDGTETHLYSARGDFVAGPGGVNGTVTSIARTDDTGATAYEIVDGIGLTVADLTAAGGRLLGIVIDGAARLEAEPIDVLDASGGHDLAAAAGLALPDFSIASAGVISWLGLDADAGDLQAAVLAPYLGGAGWAIPGLLAGGGGAYQLAGGPDDDVLLASAGRDTLDGGAGRDWADYSGAASGVEVSLAEGAGLGGEATGDLLVSVENLRGSAFGDRLAGDDGDNVIAGGRGDDVIRLGAGSDTIEFSMGDGFDVIEDFGFGGADTIRLTGISGIESFAALIEQQRLVTFDGHAEILLGGSDRLLLANVSSHTFLTAAHFGF